jgi:hypothetical protein
MTSDEQHQDDAGGYELRISRPATSEDFRQFTGDMTPEARTALLRTMQDNGTVTYAVVVPPGADQGIAGLIIGPPGSEGFLRRPIEDEPMIAPGMSALTDAEFAAANGEHVNCEHDPAGSDPQHAMVCWGPLATREIGE